MLGSTEEQALSFGRGAHLVSAKKREGLRSKASKKNRRLRASSSDDALENKPVDGHLNDDFSTERHSGDAKPVLSPEKQARKCRNSAIYRLAKREHSCFELRKTLRERFPDFDPEVIEQTLARLEGDGQLSDQRFAEAYVRMRYRRGLGPQRIVRELGERGIKAAMAADALVAEDYDWFQSACDVRQRKFGDGSPADFKAKMKQQSFLYYRGFDREQIQVSFEV